MTTTNNQHEATCFCQKCTEKALTEDVGDLCLHLNFVVIKNIDSTLPSINVCTYCTQEITDKRYTRRHTCIECKQLIPPIERIQDCPARRIVEHGRAGIFPHQFK